MIGDQISIFDLLRGTDRVVEPIEREKAKLFVEAIHYSRKLPSNVVSSFGLYSAVLPLYELWSGYRIQDSDREGG